MAELRFLDSSNWINAYEAGDQQRQAREKRIVSQRAGALIGAGDYKGAAGAMYGAGELQTGSAIDNLGRQHANDAVELDEAKRERLKESFKYVHSVFRTIETPEQLEELKADPRIAELVPDIATADMDTVKRIVQTGDSLFPEDTVVVGNSLVGRQSGKPRYTAPRQPQYRVVDGSLYELGGDEGSPEAADPQAEPADWSSGVAAAAPDARVTSGYRSPADNARVGGVANSRHLTGEAVDLIPRPGETMAQLHARVRGVPGVKTINEGDHVHVQRQVAPRSGGPKVIIQGKPKVEERWVDLPGGGQMNTKTGKKDGVPGTDKAPTEAQNKAVSFAYRTQKANQRMTALVDRGIVKPKTATAQLFDTDKNGIVRVVTKTDEDRQFMQAAKEWLAPVLRKDTGAAVTDSELAVYMDIYIPRYEDDAQTIRQKAAARKDAMIALVGETGGLYERQYGKPNTNVSFVPPKQAGKNRPPLSQIFGR